MKTINEELLNKIFEYIKDYQLENGISPSYREIQRGVGASSLSVIHRYVDILKSRNVFPETENGSIGISDELAISNSRIVPLVGQVACGQPILAIENIQGNYKLPEDILGSGEYFMLTAKGDSMYNAGIRDGDLLLVRKQPAALNGDIVVAMIDGEATVKTYRPQKDKIILQAENESYKDIEVKDCEILGIVETSIHKVKRR